MVITRRENLKLGVIFIFSILLVGGGGQFHWEKSELISSGTACRKHDDHWKKCEIGCAKDIRGGEDFTRKDTCLSFGIDLAICGWTRSKCQQEMCLCVTSSTHTRTHTQTSQWDEKILRTHTKPNYYEQPKQCWDCKVRKKGPHTNKCVLQIFVWKKILGLARGTWVTSGKLPKQHFLNWKVEGF